MKKRQKPIILVTLLAVLVVAAVGVNYYQDPERQQQAQQQAQQQQDEDEMIAQQRQADHSNIGATAANQMKPGGASKGGHIMPPEGVVKPSIMNPKPYKPPKPTPNDSSTSSQWYTDTAAKTGG